MPRASLRLAAVALVTAFCASEPQAFVRRVFACYRALVFGARHRRLIEAHFTTAMLW